jgi:gluconate:H+ symporter, GntP family
MDQSQAALLGVTVAAIVGLVILVARFKLNAFIALILASLFVSICSGKPLVESAKAFQDGVGQTLGFIAVVVGLGTMLGKLLAESGGAEVIATRFINLFGRQRLSWALVFVAFIVGLPVFFGVGLVLLVPILFTLARDTRLPLLYLGIPIVAGLSASHGLVPPHPGPLNAIVVLGADTGRTILYSLAIGIPAAILAGPVFGGIISRRLSVEVGGIGALLTTPTERKRCPSFGIALFTILLPVLLMLLATIADLTLAKENRVRAWADFVGTPLVAMLAAVIVSLFTFGYACGFGRGQIQKFTDECVGPAASIMLVVGAGGGFSKVLQVIGAADAIAAGVKSMGMSPLIFAWLLAAAVRVAVGSATVAISLSAALVAPIAAANPGVSKELLVIAMGAGSLILSHLNDGGFWFVKEYLNMSVAQTLKTWTVLETIISVTALAGVLILDALI